MTQGWALAVAGWVLVAALTAEASLPGAPLRLIDARAFVLASSANGLLFALLLWELRYVVRAPVGLRRAQLAAQVAALALLVALQVLAHQAHG